MDKTEAYIEKQGDKYIVWNHDGSKKLGEYSSEQEAKKRLKQIEYFKHQNAEMILSTGQFLTKESPSARKIVAVKAPATKEEIRALIEKNIIKENV